MELPHSGTRARFGYVLPQESQCLGPPPLPGSAPDDSMRRRSPALGVHGADRLAHVRQSLGRLVDDQVGAFSHEPEVIVCDERGYLDDHVPGGIEAGHLQIEPGEHEARLTTEPDEATL